MKKFLISLVSIFLGVVFISTTSYAAPIGYSVNSDGDDNLYSIDLATGAYTKIGAVGFSDVEGLAFQPGTGTLFGYDDVTDKLITIDLTTGAGTAVGSAGVSGIIDVGITFDAAGNLFMVGKKPVNACNTNIIYRLGFISHGSCR